MPGERKHRHTVFPVVYGGNCGLSTPHPGKHIFEQLQRVAFVHGHLIGIGKPHKRRHKKTGNLLGPTGFPGNIKFKPHIIDPFVKGKTAAWPSSCRKNATLTIPEWPADPHQNHVPAVGRIECPARNWPSSGKEENQRRPLPPPMGIQSQRWRKPEPRVFRPPTPVFGERHLERSAFPEYGVSKHPGVRQRASQGASFLLPVSKASGKSDFVGTFLAVIAVDIPNQKSLVQYIVLE